MEALERSCPRRIRLLRGLQHRTPCGISGRAVGALGPIAVGVLAAKYSFHEAIGLLSSVYLLDIFATLFLIPELRGKPLD